MVNLMRSDTKTETERHATCTSIGVGGVTVEDGLTGM
jgi:hypothetical protein